MKYRKAWMVLSAPYRFCDRLVAQGMKTRRHAIVAAGLMLFVLLAVVALSAAVFVVVWAAWLASVYSPWALIPLALGLLYAACYGIAKAAT